MQFLIELPRRHVKKKKKKENVQQFKRFLKVIKQFTAPSEQLLRSHSRRFWVNLYANIAEARTPR